MYDDDVRSELLCRRHSRSIDGPVINAPVSFVEPAAKPFKRLQNGQN